MVIERSRNTEELIWDINNILRDLESTFRCMKTDIEIRPIHHQKDENTEAHLFVGMVAEALEALLRTN